MIPLYLISKNIGIISLDKIWNTNEIKLIYLTKLNLTTWTIIIRFEKKKNRKKLSIKPVYFNLITKKVISDFIIFIVLQGCMIGHIVVYAFCVFKNLCLPSVSPVKV